MENLEWRHNKMFSDPSVTPNCKKKYSWQIKKLKHVSCLFFFEAISIRDPIQRQGVSFCHVKHCTKWLSLITAVPSQKDLKWKHWRDLCILIIPELHAHRSRSPCLRKFGYQSIWTILVITWLYVRPFAPLGNQWEMSNFLASVGAWNLCLTW